MVTPSFLGVACCCPSVAVTPAPVSHSAKIQPKTKPWRETSSILWVQILHHVLQVINCSSWGRAGGRSVPVTACNHTTTVASGWRLVDLNAVESVLEMTASLLARLLIYGGRGTSSKFLVRAVAGIAVRAKAKQMVAACSGFLKSAFTIWGEMCHRMWGRLPDSLVAWLSLFSLWGEGWMAESSLPHLLAGIKRMCSW